MTEYDYKNDDLAFEARYAAEATETCHLCGQPSAPCESRIHRECERQEQFAADRESFQLSSI